MLKTLFEERKDSFLDSFGKIEFSHTKVCNRTTRIPRMMLLGYLAVQDLTPALLFFNFGY